MVHACDACGAAERPDDPLVHLHELDSAASPEAGEIGLCLNCMMERAPATWPAESEEAQRMLEAFQERGVPHAEHYTYLAEHEAGQDNLHLVAFDPDWVQERLQAHAAGGEEETSFDIVERHRIP